MSNNSHGFSLVSVLVGIAMAGILSLVLSSVMSNNNKMSAKLFNDTDINSLKNGLTQQVSCAKTLYDAANNPVCTEGAVIPLKDKNNNIIGNFAVKKDQGYQIIPNWFIKPICRGANLEIRLAKVNNQNEYWKNPVTSQIMDYTNKPNPIFAPFPNGIPLCGGSSSKYVKARVQAGGGGYVVLPLGGPAGDDFIYNSNATAAFCSDTNLNGGTGLAAWNSTWMCDMTQQRVKKITCNTAKGLSLVSCVGSNLTSSAPQIIYDQDGVTFRRRIPPCSI